MAITFSKEKLRAVLEGYKAHFEEQWKYERYKWQAVRHFQENWDIEAGDFSEMLNRSLDKTYNLLASANNFPKGMLAVFAKAAPEIVRGMFRDLFDESKDAGTRIQAFKQRSATLLGQYGGGAAQHYQYENAISTYLWLRYPDVYYIYKFGEVKTFSETIEADCHFKKGSYLSNIRQFMELYDEINKMMKGDSELVHLLQTHLDESCYPDSELKTLTVDVSHYVSVTAELTHRDENDYEDSASSETIAEVVSYWWLVANPRIWSFSSLTVGREQNYTLYNENNHKRRIFQNFLAVKPGDLVIGYESAPSKKIVALGQITQGSDGKEIRFQKTEGLAEPVTYAALKDCPELAQMEFFQQSNGSLFKLTKEEYDFLLDVIRESNPISEPEKKATPYSEANFLADVYLEESEFQKLKSLLLYKRNIILQGPPGVGKTFAARRLAWAILGRQDDSHVKMVQFHQNTSYEDFVMGYRPTENGFELREGVFLRFCQEAQNHPEERYFFLVDEINRGNLSKIFGELLMLLEKDYRDKPITMAYDGRKFAVPGNVYLIGMMNTADRSLALIDYALRRRFAFFPMKPGFESMGFKTYRESLRNQTLERLIKTIQELNRKIVDDPDLGEGFQIGHSYFCGWKIGECTDQALETVVEYEILPTLREYWFDEKEKVEEWEKRLRGVFHG